MKRKSIPEPEVFIEDPSMRFAALKQSTEEWISRTDSKAMTMLGTGGAILALAGFQTMQHSTDFLPYFAGIFLVLFCSFGVMSCISSVCCLWPRTQRKRLLRDKSVQPLAKSPSVFWDLADLDVETFSSLVVYASPETRERDMLEQTLVTAWVAKQKLFWLRIALVLFLGALFSLFLALVTSIVAV